MLYEAVVIGASSGGLAALIKILGALPGNFPLPVIVAQHLHPSQDEKFIEPLNECCQLTVKCADEKESILPGNVYFAPPNYHLLVEKDRTFSLSIDERVRYARPSIDVLFESAADYFSAHLIGVILTGANDDGASGVREIKEKGGLVIIQDPKTAEVSFMPLAAIALVKADHILPLEEIGPMLVSIITR